MTFLHSISNDKDKKNDTLVQYQSGIVGSDNDHRPLPKVDQSLLFNNFDFTTFIGSIVNTFRKIGTPIIKTGGVPSPDNSPLSSFLFKNIQEKLLPQKEEIPLITPEMVNQVIAQNNTDILASLPPFVPEERNPEIQQSINNIENDLAVMRSLLGSLQR